MQTFPELGCILSAEELDELESEIDPLTVVADKLTAYNRQCLLGPAQVNAGIFGGIEGDLKGLGVDFASCMRILGGFTSFKKIVNSLYFYIVDPSSQNLARREW